MYDIHSHILYGVDDGAESIEKSLEMIRQAAAEEVGVIIATPHYIEGLYANGYEDNLARLDMLKKEADKAGINIKLYLGNEVRISHELPSLIESKKVATLNNSRYILVELPFLDIPPYTEKVVYDLELKGYKVILAHPERNQCVINNPDILYNLIKQGALVQINIPSFEGRYGRSVKRITQLLLRHNLVHFIGTDSHTPREGHSKLKVLAEKLRHYCNDTISDLFYDNPLQVIMDEPIRIHQPQKVSPHPKGTLR